MPTGHTFESRKDRRLGVPTKAGVNWRKKSDRDEGTRERIMFQSGFAKKKCCAALSFVQTGGGLVQPARERLRPT